MIRHELAYYFLPYLERLNGLDDLIAYLHWHKPNQEEMISGYRHHSYFYNWLTVTYLLLVEGRGQQAEFCLEKIIYTLHSVDSHTYNGHIAEGMFGLINKLQKDFALNRSYKYDEESKRIITV